MFWYCHAGPPTVSPKFHDDAVAIAPESAARSWSKRWVAPVGYASAAALNGRLPQILERYANFTCGNEPGQPHDKVICLSINIRPARTTLIYHPGRVSLRPLSPMQLVRIRIFPTPFALVHLSITHPRTAYSICLFH